MLRLNDGRGARALSFAAALVAALVSLEASGHMRILPTGTLVPRDTNTGNKTGPCGTARSTNLNVLAPGQSLLVQWEETIDHPGHYRIAFSPAGDQGFDQNVLADNLQDIQGGTLPHEYSATITVPSTLCETCTIQVIQYMTETTPASLYYSCADIAIRNSGASPSPSPAPSPSASPSPQVSVLPVPTPTPTCN